MPYKDPEAKRRYMSRYYEQKIKTGEIPCTAYRKGSYGLTNSYANKTQASRSAILGPKSSISQPISPSQALPALREQGLIHSFPSNVKGNSPCRQAERNTRSVFPEDLQVWGTALSCDLLSQGKISGRAVLTGIVSGLPTTRPESAEHPGLATFDEHDQAVINRLLSGTLLKVRSGARFSSGSFFGLSHSC
jgi:hypothetical protein